MIASDTLGGVTIERTVVVVRSVLEVGEATMNVRDEIVGAPGTSGWLNLRV
jgi:hypothetical protein